MSIPWLRAVVVRVRVLVRIFGGLTRSMAIAVVVVATCIVVCSCVRGAAPVLIAIPISIVWSVVTAAVAVSVTRVS